MSAVDWPTSTFLADRHPWDDITDLRMLLARLSAAIGNRRGDVAVGDARAAVAAWFESHGEYAPLFTQPWSDEAVPEAYWLQLRAAEQRDVRPALSDRIANYAVPLLFIAILLAGFLLPRAGGGGDCGTDWDGRSNPAICGD